MRRSFTLGTPANSITNRSLDDPPDFDHLPQDFLRYHTRCFAGNIVDFDEYFVHVRFLSHVSLRSWRTVRVQRRSVRQPEYVGADRRRCTVHPSKEVPAQRANHPLFTEHSLHPLRPNLLHYQLSGRPCGRDSKATICEALRTPVVNCMHTNKHFRVTECALAFSLACPTKSRQ